MKRHLLSSETEILEYKMTTKFLEKNFFVCNPGVNSDIRTTAESMRWHLFETEIATRIKV